MIVCKICGKEISTWWRFGLHLRLDHDMTTQQYYDKFFKEEGEGKCKVCGKPTNFVNAVQGYRETCGGACRNILRGQQMMHETVTMTCAECGKELSAKNEGGLIKSLNHHLQKIHNMSIKEYYDKYKKKEGEGICPVCGQPTQFLGYTAGYSKTCSLECGKKLELQNGTNAGQNDTIKIKKEAERKYNYIAEQKKIQDYYKSLVDDDEVNKFPEKEKVISQAMGALTNNGRRDVRNRLYTEVDTCNYDMPMETESMNMSQRRRYSYVDEVTEEPSVQWL